MLRGMVATVMISSTLIAGAEPVLTYKNPLDVPVADPHVLKDNGVYYLYGTGPTSYGFPVYTSTDLVNWSRRGLAYREQRGDWPERDFWAPEVYRVNDKYYMYFTARNSESYRRNVGVAVADSPLGPFKNLKAPLFPDHSVIDPHVFFDDDGKMFVYATDESNPKQGRILGAELDASMTKIRGELKECIVPTQTWERGWVEAPFMVKHGGKYMMMYSGSAFDRPSYSVAYAVGNSPLGPFTKPENNRVLQQTDTVHGPGHHAIVKSPDDKETFIVYHVHQALHLYMTRMVAIDRISIGDVIEAKDAPTSTPQPLPSGAIPMQTAISDEFDSTTLDRTRWTVYEEMPQRWRLKDGALVIDSAEGDFFRDNNTGENYFMQYAPEGDFTIETKAHFPLVRRGDQVNIVVWQDMDNFVKAVALESYGPRLEAGVEILGKYDMYLLDTEPRSTHYLRIVKRGDEYQCFGSGDGKEWAAIGDPMRNKLKRVKVGFGVFMPEGGESREAKFEYFRISTP